jgi:glutaryl-CoA dehydrogenase
MTSEDDRGRAAAATDYYLLDEQLTDDERAIRYRVRAFGEQQVLPVINE